jgi:hypothetical protein
MNTPAHTLGSDRGGWAPMPTTTDFERPEGEGGERETSGARRRLRKGDAERRREARRCPRGSRPFRSRLLHPHFAHPPPLPIPEKPSTEENPGHGTHRIRETRAVAVVRRVQVPPLVLQPQRTRYGGSARGRQGSRAIHPAISGEWPGHLDAADSKDRESGLIVEEMGELGRIGGTLRSTLERRCSILLSTSSF